MTSDGVRGRPTGVSQPLKDLIEQAMARGLTDEEIRMQLNEAVPLVRAWMDKVAGETDVPLSPFKQETK